MTDRQCQYCPDASHFLVWCKTPATKCTRIETAIGTIELWYCDEHYSIEQDERASAIIGAYLPKD